MLLRVFHGLGLELSEATAHSLAVPVAFAFITVLHITFGELAPKSIAIRYPSKTTFAVAVPLKVFYVIFRPFIWLLNGLANFILKIFGIHPVHGSDIHSDEGYTYRLDNFQGLLSGNPIDYSAMYREELNLGDTEGQWSHKYRFEMISDLHAFTTLFLQGLRAEMVR